MKARTDRTWPLPKQPWVMRMTWSELLFAHWQVDPDKVASSLLLNKPKSYNGIMDTHALSTEIRRSKAERA